MSARTVKSGKTIFSMSQVDAGQWKGKWIINNSYTGRAHLILDSEADANAAMDSIEANAHAADDLRAWQCATPENAEKLLSGEIEWSDLPR